MPRFNFFDIRQPSVEGAYGQALQGELARAETQGAWAQALDRAIQVANARNDRREALRAEAQMRRELAMIAQTGETARAQLQEAGQKARSKRFLTSQQAAQAENARQFNVEQAQKEAALARDQAGMAAFGQLMTGQAEPMIGPPAPQPAGFVGPPPPPSTLDKAMLLSQLPPQVQQMYLLSEERDRAHAAEMEKQRLDFGFRQQQHADELAIAQRSAAVQEGQLARQTEADIQSKRKSLYERAVEIASKMPNLKKKAADAAGMEESDESYQARFDAQVEKIMAQIGQEQAQAQIGQDPYAALDMGSSATASSAGAAAAPVPGTVPSGQQTSLYGIPLDAQQQAFVNDRSHPIYRLLDWFNGKGEKPATVTPRQEILKRARELISSGKKDEAAKLLSSIGINTADEARAALAGQ